MARNDESLFSTGDLSALLHGSEEAIRKEVEGYDGNKLLNTPADDLCAYFLEKHHIEPIRVG